MTQKLPGITQGMYNNPQNPMFLKSRAVAFLELGFAELAAGDAYKIIEFLDEKLRADFQKSYSSYEDLSGIPFEEARAAVAAFADMQKTSYKLLFYGLQDINEGTTAKAMVQEARTRYPSDRDFEMMKEQNGWVLEEGVIAKHLRKTDNDPRPFKNTSNRDHGTVFHLAYPFIPQAFLSRSEELIQATKKEIEGKAKAFFSSCSPSSSPVQAPTESTSNGAPPALGIFASRDLAEDEPFLVDTTVLAATENYDRTRNTTEICDNCCGNVPTNSNQKRSARCCAVLYCSAKCEDLARKNYHEVLCKQDFSWVRDSKTGHSHYDLDGPIWLRILAVCVRNKAHPLELPLIARLTPLYDEYTPRRWTLSNRIMMPLRILQQLGIDIYADSRFDIWVLQTLWARMLTNAQETDERKLSEVYFRLTLRSLWTALVEIIEALLSTNRI